MIRWTLPTPCWSPKRSSWSTPQSVDTVALRCRSNKAKSAIFGIALPLTEETKSTLLSWRHVLQRSHLLRRVWKVGINCGHLGRQRDSQHSGISSSLYPHAADASIPLMCYVGIDLGKSQSCLRCNGKSWRYCWGGCSHTEILDFCLLERYQLAVREESAAAWGRLTSVCWGCGVSSCPFRMA